MLKGLWIIHGLLVTELLGARIYLSHTSVGLLQAWMHAQNAHGTLHAYHVWASSPGSCSSESSAIVSGCKRGNVFDDCGRAFDPPWEHIERLRRDNYHLMACRRAPVGVVLFVTENTIRAKTWFHPDGCSVLIKMSAEYIYPRRWSKLYTYPQVTYSGIADVEHKQFWDDAWFV